MPNVNQGWYWADKGKPKNLVTFACPNLVTFVIESNVKREVYQRYQAPQRSRVLRRRAVSFFPIGCVFQLSAS